MSTSPLHSLVQRFSSWRFKTTPSKLVLIVAGWLLLTANWPFWRVVWEGVGGWSNGNILFLASLPIFVLCWLYILLSLLAWGRLSKPVLSLLVLVSASAGYFMNAYGIVIDYSMLTNVVQTDQAEALDLVNGRMIAWVAFFGVLPALLIFRTQLTSRGWKREVSAKLGGMTAAIVCLLAVAFVFYQPYASLIRNHREVRLLLVPSNVVAAAHGYLKRQLASPAQLERVGEDAHRIARAGSGGKPRVTVVVVGETARAANFSLNGYPRETNPELGLRGVVNFPKTTSCGTATAVSVPCMFLDVGHDNYKDSMAGNREGLLDVLQRAGVEVLWRDNNSGCKGACDRVPHEDLSNLDVPTLCADGECQDEILLYDLQRYLDQLNKDAVIVLHMKGSHGPAYYKRYPKAFETFTPVCKSNQLDQCSRESIVNAYDNSITYTDYVLSAAIDLLQSNSNRLDTAMLYVSDHGESLGEGGIYLHGLPYAMAPSEQTHVPMVLWLSSGMEESSGVSSQCMKQHADAEVSQDYLFHSVLSLMKVTTSAYQRDLDLFLPCQTERTAQADLPGSKF